MRLDSSLRSEIYFHSFDFNFAIVSDFDWWHTDQPILLLLEFACIESAFNESLIRYLHPVAIGNKDHMAFIEVKIEIS